MKKNTDAFVDINAFKAIYLTKDSESGRTEVISLSYDPTTMRA